MYCAAFIGGMGDQCEEAIDKKVWKLFRFTVMKECNEKMKLSRNGGDGGIRTLGAR